MRNQEFHKGVDGLKSLGTPALEGTQLVGYCLVDFRTCGLGKCGLVSLSVVILDLNEPLQTSPSLAWLNEV